MTDYYTAWHTSGIPNHQAVFSYSSVACLVYEKLVALHFNESQQPKDQIIQQFRRPDYYDSDQQTPKEAPQTEKSQSHQPPSIHLAKSGGGVGSVGDMVR